MADQVFLNNAVGSNTVQAEIIDTTITVDATLASDLAGVNFPSEFILLTINAANSPTDWEIVKATSIAGQVVTVERAQEGTTAAQWVIGSEVSARATADSYRRAREQVFRLLTDVQGRLLLGVSGEPLLGAEV